MKSEITKFFTIQRQIFGICPRSGQLFRLSDCKIFLKRRPVPDWMDRCELEEQRLSMLGERLDAKEEDLREKAREKGRQLARRVAAKIDSVFTPRRLNPGDAKVVFHPIDYIVFNGMKEADSIKNIILLDRQTRESHHRTLQKSIERVIERGNYEWQTLRVREDGEIKIE